MTAPIRTATDLPQRAATVARSMRAAGVTTTLIHDVCRYLDIDGEPSYDVLKAIAVALITPEPTPEELGKIAYGAYNARCAEEDWDGAQATVDSVFGVVREKSPGQYGGGDAKKEAAAKADLDFARRRIEAAETRVEPFTEEQQATFRRLRGLGRSARAAVRRGEVR